MDAGTLLQLLQATLSADTNMRVDAELRIKQLETHAGFLPTMMHILSSTETDVSIRLVAAVYFKNTVKKYWNDDQDRPHIAESDKSVVRHGVLDTIVHAPPTIRSQLALALNLVLSYDFPIKWPEYVEHVSRYLQQTQNMNAMHGGLIAMQELVKVFQWRSDTERAPLTRIVKAIFPYLQQIGMELLKHENEEAAIMLKVILKTYYNSISFDLSKAHQEPSNLIAWGSVFIAMVEKPLTEQNVPATLDNEEKGHHPWWKAKKWAYHCLNKLFSRYGNPSLNSFRNEKKYKSFAKVFLTNFAPSILRSYLKQTELMISSETNNFVSPRVKYLQANFYSDCAKNKVTWTILKPYAHHLITHFIFPQLCFSDEDAELWEDNPSEFINRKRDPLEDYRSPASAAQSLLIELAISRRKVTFDTILAFTHDIMSRYQIGPQTEELARLKDGALNMISCIADLCLSEKSSVKSDMEAFLVSYVFPDFVSPYNFLRARALNTLTAFIEIKYTNPQHARQTFEAVMNCLRDPELPIRVEAGLALEPMIHKPHVHDAMIPHISSIMTALLDLQNQIDVDSLAEVMESFVESFPAQVAPFAVQLCEQLVASFLRIMEEAQASLPTDDDQDFDSAGDKTMMAISILKTLQTLILTVDESKEIMQQLEERFTPAVAYVLDNEILDLYDDVFEIIYSCTFSCKSVSPVMWSLFDKLYIAFKNGAIDYISEMVPALDNYITYGKEAFAVRVELQQALVDIITTTMTASNLGESERLVACTLMESMMLNLRGLIDQLIPYFMALVFAYLNDVIKTNEFRILCLETVVNALYYNPVPTLQILEQNGWTSIYFTLWLQNINKFTRVHDKKLCVLALCSLMQLPLEQVPISVRSGWPKLLEAILGVLESYPKALEARKEQEKFLSGEDDEDEDDEEDEIDDEDGDESFDETNEGDDDQGVDEEQQYLEYLAQNAAGAGKDEEDEDEDSEDELQEDLYFESPLDAIDPYVVFSDVFNGLSHSNPTSYQLFASSLIPEQQAFIMSVFQKASEHRASQTAEAS